MNELRFLLFRIGIRISVLVLGAVVLAAVCHADDGSTLEILMGPSGIPTPNAADVAAFNSLYNPGFDGMTDVLTTPETFDYGPSVTEGEQILISTVESDWDNGDFSAADPLVIGGYSQSAVIASDAEQALYNYGIPSDAIHFDLIGDTASAQGGFLNTIAEEPFWSSLLTDLGWSNLIGNTTPDDLYPTTVYTIDGDAWADAVANAWNGDYLHYDYLGLSPTEIADATTVVNGMTTYIDIATPVDWITPFLDEIGMGL